MACPGLMKSSGSFFSLLKRLAAAHKSLEYLRGFLNRVIGPSESEMAESLAESVAAAKVKKTAAAAAEAAQAAAAAAKAAEAAHASLEGA